MDNTREKLIELLTSVPPIPVLIEKGSEKGQTVAEYYADHLIANGVTVQKHGHWVIKNIKNSKYRYCFCSECQTMGSSEWKVCPVCETKMDLPEPPKGD